MSATNKNQEKEHAGAPNDSDDDFKYEEVSLEDDWSLTEGEEDLDATVKAIQNRAEANARAATSKRKTHQPEAVDDFLRNFLFHAGMTETLDCFQTEWTEMMQKGLVDAERVGVVPDVYIDNLRLDSELKNAQREREEYRLAASAAAETLVRVQKARDFHRLQHKRVVQEKNRLIEEIRRLKVQCNNYEPAIKRMNEKYHAVLKQTVLVTLERDKALGRVNRQSAQDNTHFCGDAGEEEINKKGEASVKGTTRPVTQPKSPTSRPHRESD
ncbi:sperm-associated antigen 16 protein [Lates calcarifer]|uniref:Sperm-associated antigen 16 protein n=1 Tax=Lates calcarifer TaxID=8187 RepID=A0AAJ8AXJ1_LATCA|nr:sperm-associated antigen 16 protein [Lates calcarifer]